MRRDDPPTDYRSHVFKGFCAGDVPWAHLDIASTAYLSEAKRYHPKFATVLGVRLLIEFLEQ